MQVWALLTGGGRGQPCRIVLYTDVCILNQTTLQLEYLLKDSRTPILSTPTLTTPLLAPTPEAAAPGGGGGEAPESANTAPARRALSLLCTRSDPSQSMPELRLKVRGVNAAMSANQRFESEDGKPATHFALCEPHERMLNGTFLESLSTPFSTSNATYHGEIWLAEHLGVLGVQSQVQAQELAPRTAVMAIRPRFLLVNKLDEAVQFHGVQMKEAPSRVAGKPLHIADILRTAPADAAASSTERYAEEQP